VVYAGDALIQRVPLKWVRIVAASVFAALGVYALVFA
jgi:putative Ca2+/H+ antiporter (TMEM165/GDT1 family)